MNSDIISERLRDVLPSLGAHATTAAKHLLAHPQDAALRSMRELAQRLAIPPATLVRLAQRIGLSGFDDLRRSYADAIRDRGVVNADQAARIVSAARSKGVLGFAARFVAEEQALLQRTAGSLSTDVLEQAAAALAAAGRVYVLGRRTLYPVAWSMAYSMRKARAGVILADTGGIQPGTELDEAGRGDVVVVFSFGRYSRITYEHAKAAADRGGVIIAVTDSPRAPVARIARHVLITDTKAQAFPDSIIGATVLANLLVALVVARLGRKALTRIQENDRQIASSGEYFPRVPPEV
ncbi:MAG: MurR/RpiR family transcriptional regulator [Alphaproteobacteria bacterium]|nr:MurR/RpiR family transcriptional regulator [Alphaproteobacteria bacterium]